MKYARWIGVFIVLALVAGCGAMGKTMTDDNFIVKWNTLTPQEKSIAMAQQFFIFESTYEALTKKPNPTAEEKGLMKTEYSILSAIQPAIIGYNDAFTNNDPMAMANFEIQFLNLANKWLMTTLSK